jgi:hypothetical protein
LTRATFSFISSLTLCLFKTLSCSLGIHPPPSPPLARRARWRPSTQRVGTRPTVEAGGEAARPQSTKVAVEGPRGRDTTSVRSSTSAYDGGAFNCYPSRISLSLSLSLSVEGSRCGGGWNNRCIRVRDCRGRGDSNGCRILKGVEVGAPDLEGPTGWERQI